MIMQGEQQAKVLVSMHRPEFDKKIQVNIVDSPKEKGRYIILDDCMRTNPHEIAGMLYAVVFCPAHLSLVTGSPSVRRNFADACLCQIYPNFLKTYKMFIRSLKQKNTLLKNFEEYSKEEFEGTLEILNSALADLGYEIYLKRSEFFSLMSEKAKNYYEGISSGREKIEFKYLNFAHSRQEHFEKLCQNSQRDIKLGFSCCGVQREDFDIFIEGRSAKEFASQGQQRSIALSMKLAESDIINEICGVQPIILLDDVLSELDFTRQEYLLNHIQNKQVFITTCDENRIKLSEKVKYSVKNGSIENCSI